MAPTQLQFDAQHRLNRGWLKSGSAPKTPAHPHSRDSDFDPVREGEKSAATSIEAFKKALNAPERRNSK